MSKEQVTISNEKAANRKTRKNPYSIAHFSFLIAHFFFALCAGCTVNTLVADALTGQGSSAVFTGDSDPQLVGDALPFAIKMYEALLDSTPNHIGLRLTTGSLFVMYANAFVQGPAEMLPAGEWRQRENELKRAKELYMRGQEILYGALDLKYKGFSKADADGKALLLNKCKKEDAGLLYWAVAGGMAAYSLDIFDFELGMRLPEWILMIQRAYQLDPGYNGAALDEFLLLFYASLPEVMGGDKERAKEHFKRALEKTGGKSTGAYISYAQSICVPVQDYDAYKDSLEKALAVDPDADISSRLVTIINQRKARWLLDNAYLNFSFLPIPDNY
ncbi:MAG: TRAP transporter TatT component family protein [Treponema sp.]|jgi:predicted anti-sigma-YlaC factor YlaD|nr:TRAP transporter TatT component family protein [Treponema sp.]